jgi:hypothetical protein
MKTRYAFLMITLFLVSGFQGTQYEEAMKQAIGEMNSNEHPQGLLEAANTFERISLNEPDQWLPLYYAAYAYILISYQEQELTQKDPLLDKAQGFLDKAFCLAPGESELYALQAFLYPSRITVDPMGRGMEYMGLLNQAIDKAIELNPENPRSYYLRAIITLNLPEAFGGGAGAAKPVFEKAKEKFDRFQPESSLSPDWGKEINRAELEKLNQ